MGRWICKRLADLEGYCRSCLLLAWQDIGPGRRRRELGTSSNPTFHTDQNIWKNNKTSTGIIIDHPPAATGGASIVVPAAP